MRKRYVFWRKPNGTPDHDNDSKNSPRQILSAWGKSATLNADGSVSFGLNFFEGWEVGIKSAAVVLDPEGHELNDRDAWQIVCTGMIAATKKTGGQQPLKDPDVLTESDAVASAFFRRTLEKYTLVSSLSVASLPFTFTKVKNHHFKAIASRKRFPIPQIVSHYAGLANHVKTSKYQLLRISTSGRSVYEAVDSGLDALHLLRGLWTLFSTFRSWSIKFGGAPEAKPVGIIHTGPIYTLHLRNGKLVGENPIFWYEPGYTKDYDLYTPDNAKWKAIESHRNWAMRKIAKSPFQEEITQLIIRYATALDQSDYGVAFLQLWGVLEKLTATVGSNYEETIKRAAWPFEDRETSRELLRSMRLRRNLYVHAAVKAQDTDQAIYLVKGFVDVHLLRLIRNDFKANSVEEYARHLTLPTNISTLKRDRLLLNSVITALSKKPIH